MRYATLSRSHLSFSGRSWRGSLLGIVVALHAGLLLLLLAAKSVTPLLLETPLMVHFIEPPPPPPVVIEEPPKALPMVVPEPPIPPPPLVEPPPPPKKPVAPKRPLPTPLKKVNTPAPLPAMSALETTASEEPASDSAVQVPPEAVASEPTASRDTGAAASNGDGTGVLVGARFDADYLRNPKPPYPPYSRRLGEEGKVILRVLVSAEGNAQEVELHTSSGSSRLDDSALRTVRAWKFVPAKRAGVAVESRVLVPILFKLEQ